MPIPNWLVVNGDIKAQEPNPAVSTSLLKYILKCLSENLSWQDILVILRSKTVPEGYTPHNWKLGTGVLVNGFD